MTSSFRAQLNRAYENKVLKTQERVTRLTGLALISELVFNTPVDTGRAKGNWNIDINTIDLTDREAEKDGSGSISRANSITASYKLNETIFVSNNLPYINRLNDGYSGQAPAGFVEAAIQTANLKAKELAKQ